MADAATRKAAPDAGRVTPGLADGRTTDERMRDVFAERYDPELKRLAGIASSVDADLQSYLASCFQRFASIPVEGAAPRSNAVDDILQGGALVARRGPLRAVVGHRRVPVEPDLGAAGQRQLGDAVVRAAVGGRPRPRRSPEGRPRAPRARRPRPRHLSRHRARDAGRPRPRRADRSPADAAGDQRPLAARMDPPVECSGPFTTGC